MSINKSKSITICFLLILIAIFSIAGYASIKDHQTATNQIEIGHIAINTNKNGFITFRNNSTDIAEFTQLSGGHVSQNPLLENGKATLIPNLNSKLIEGHILSYNPKFIGHYIQNLLVKATKNQGIWHVKVANLYRK